MAGTQVRMDRITEATSSGTNSFIIMASCTVKGDLADTSIFLLNIITANDPKDDTLARIIEIPDITNYGISRNSAVASGAGKYRSSSVTLRYDNIDSANAAQKELKSRINKLVESYDEFLEEFETPDVGETVIYPTVDESIVTARQDAYYATLTPITDAETARDTKQRELNETQYKLDTALERLAEAASDLAKAQQIQAQIPPISGSLTSISSTFSSAKTSIRQFNSLSDASTSQKANIETQLVTLDAQLAVFSTELGKLNTVNSDVSFCVATMQARVATLTASRNTFQTELNKGNAELSKLQAAVDNARAVSAEALAAVIAICPTFIP